MTPLRRIGNKSKLVPILLNMFPKNISLFVDMFMGSGAVAFKMASLGKQVFANDIDNDVFNLFMVLKDRKNELINAIEMMPVHDTLFKFWKINKESDPIWQAVRFLMRSNFGAYGQCSTLYFVTGGNSKQILINKINAFKLNYNISFMSCDFKDILKKISWSKDIDKKKTFIYADPPYLNTDGRNWKDFTKNDLNDLFDILLNSDCRFAVSEFDNPVVVDMAKEKGLFCNYVAERKNIKNKRTEMLYTNYEVCNEKLFNNLPN